MLGVTNDNSLAGNPLGQLRVGIVGLGLMGGSLALALRGQVRSLHGIDQSAEVCRLAVRDGIVDLAEESLTAGSPTIDLLILAVPVRTILALLERLPDLRPAGCYVLDLGSTKREVVAAMSALPEGFGAIGGHPMCGKETAGIASASADLYRGQVFVLCPTARTTPALKERALDLIKGIEARPVILDVDSHDHIATAVSHLPYIVSAALMRAAVDESLWPLSASGFRDVSRLAGTDPRMMLDILLTNREEILSAIARYQADLRAFQEALERGDEVALSEWMTAAQSAHGAYRRRGKIA